MTSLNHWKKTYQLYWSGLENYCSWGKFGQSAFHHQYKLLPPVCLFPMDDPNKHDNAKSARWIWGSHLLSLPLFLSCINSSSGEPERSVCQVLSPEKNQGKLNEVWTWEQPYPSFSRGCSKHIKGSISNVQNKWRLVKPPKDILPPAIVSCCHKSQDPYAHSCVQTGKETLLCMAFFYMLTVCHVGFLFTFKTDFQSYSRWLIVSLQTTFLTWWAEQIENNL